MHRIIVKLLVELSNDFEASRVEVRGSTPASMHRTTGLITILTGLWSLSSPRLLVIVLCDLAEVYVRADNHLFISQAWVILDEHG